MKLLQHTIQPFQGIKECLQSLLSRGYLFGIVTSKTYQEYYSDFEPLGLADFFSTIVCAYDTDEHKPNAAPLVAYLAKANVSPENALYIGDSIYDIQCADNAGVDSGLVLWSNTGIVSTLNIINTVTNIESVFGAYIGFSQICY